MCNFVVMLFVALLYVYSIHLSFQLSSLLSLPLSLSLPLFVSKQREIYFFSGFKCQV